MNITKSLTFYLDDPRRWEKLGIGTAVILISSILAPLLIGIAGYFILTGYTMRLLRNVRDGVEHPLPEWDRWSDDLTVGFKYFVAILIYALPLLVLWIPTVVGAIMMDSSRGAGFIGVPLMVLGMCLLFAYALFITLATPGITLAFAHDYEIRSAFDFTGIWNWTRDHIGPVVVVSLVYLAASMVLGIGGAIVGALLCVVGLIVTIPLATLLTVVVQYHLYGQLAQEYGEPARSAAHVTALLSAPAAPAQAEAPEIPDLSEPLDILKEPEEPEAHVTYIAPSSLADFDVAPEAPDAPETPDAPEAPDVSDSSDSGADYDS